MTEEYRYFREENIVPLPLALWRNIKKNRAKTAIEYYGRRVSYGELGVFTVTVAKIIDALVETRPGEEGSVALLLPPVPQFPFFYYGALLKEKLVAPINYVPLAKQLKTKKPKEIKVGPEFSRQFEYSRPSIVVVADMFWPLLEKIGLEKLDGTTIIVTSPADFLPEAKAILYPVKALWDYGWVRVPERRNVVHLKDILRHNWGTSLELFEEYEARHVPADNIAQLQYTGGTTGIPKGAELTHRNLLSDAYACRECLGGLVGEEEVVLGALPFCHAYGLNMAMHMALLVLGGTLVLQPKFSPRETCELIERHRITLFSGSSRMFEAISPILDSCGLGSLKYCSTGAGKTPPELLLRLRKHGVPVYEGYGLSECSPVVSVNVPGCDKVGSVGKPIPGVEIKVVDEGGKEVPVDKSGEILVRGPIVMRGYHQNQEETTRAIRNGWLHTGDIMRQDEEGFLHFIDRSANSGKKNGENVYGEPIRQHLLKHPGLENCVVFFVPDEASGNVLPYVFVLPNKTFAAQKLIEHIRNNPNAAFEMPEKIIVVDTETFEPWWDPVLSKVNFKAAKKYFLENRRRLQSIL